MKSRISIDPIPPNVLAVDREPKSEHPPRESVISSSALSGRQEDPAEGSQVRFSVFPSLMR
jgi:hypothetical protein